MRRRDEKPERNDHIRAKPLDGANTGGAQRRAAFRAAPQPSAPAGQAVFAKNCIACHQVDGNGGQVGPNLAGLSKRGIDRVVEDVLDRLFSSFCVGK